MSVIEKGSTVLVTGVNGFIASHVADQLLEAGYKVKGTARSADKAKWLEELFDKKYGKEKYETVVVADMIEDGAFDEAVKGVSGICHLASIMSFSSQPEEVIPPTVAGALSVLKSASKEPGIKSFVYTSSSTAALLPEPNKRIEVTKDTWDTAAVQTAWETPEPDAFTVYGASKTEAERAVWQIAKDVQPTFQVATVLPNCNMGTTLNPEGPSSTAGWVAGLFKGDKSALQFPPQWFINVRDTARLHIAALIDPSQRGQRIFAFAAPFNWNDVLDIMRKQNPDKQFIENISDDRDLSSVPNDDAEQLLKKHFSHGFANLEDTIRENTQGL